MRIESLSFENFRQLKNTRVQLTKNIENDLHVLIGKNGTGKTNILNAINWCLYGEEPHLSKDSKKLPILNLNSIDEAKDGGEKKVLVEFQVKTDDNRNITFSREAVYIIYKEKEQRVNFQVCDFEVKVSDKKGNTDILKNEDADSYVERFVPKAIREFFFFDGERLDTYFREATAENIRRAIFVISQIELLENKLEKKIKDVLKELRKDAGRVNPKIEKVENELEESENKFGNVEKEIEECNKQIRTARGEINGCDKKLRGVPDIEAYEQEKLRLKASKKHTEQIRDVTIREKQDLLFEYGNSIMLWPAIKASIKKIEEKRIKKELPPTIDKSLLENVLQNETCSICGKPLDDDSKSRVANLLEEIKLSSDIAQQLLNMENPLYLFEDKNKQFDVKIKEITFDVIKYEKEVDIIAEKINKIDKDISGYSPNKVKNWYEYRKKQGDVLETKLQLLGQSKEKRDKLKEKIDSLKVLLKVELGNEETANKLSKEIDFCMKSLDVIKSTKEVIMNKTRKKIESTTKKLFFQFIWKKETFKEINIDENYNIELIHSMGYECLGSLSAAERELLALSFTLALHTISGFDSPILIDTPVARVSDEHRKNFGKILAEISKNKQIILLFTPAEYSIEISKLLEMRSSNRFNCNISSDERETKLEVVKNA